jgi:uncharacterized phage-associated protein
MWANAPHTKLSEITGMRNAHVDMKTYSASDIARYFLAKSDFEDGDLISNLKLQKLCYYAQGVGLVARAGAPLFSERIEAWLHGPVVPALYSKYKEAGRNAIPAVTDLDIEKYDAADRIILDDVFDYYSQYSAWRLREMTHEEAPWKNAYAEDQNKIITPNVLMDFFKDQVAPGYREKYEQVSRAHAEKS